MRSRLPLSSRDWSRLPDDVIVVIMSRISAVEDLIVFSAVCRSWRSVAVREYLVRRRTQLPWLMLAENHNAETRGFYSIYRDKRHNVEIPPDARGRRCWGSQYGWLLVLEFDRQFYLFNPLTRVRFDLPPKPIFRGEFDHDDRDNLSASVPGFVRKAFVFRRNESSSTSSSQDHQFVVVAIGNLSGNLAFARPGEEKNWIQVKAPFGRIASAAWCNGRLFAILGTGELLCCESSEHQGSFEAKQFASRLEIANDIWEDNIYQKKNIWEDNISLVESFGDLLLVLRYLCVSDKHWHKTMYFDVWKLDFETKEWIQVNDLGDLTLFIDADNSAMSLRSSEVECCKGNCIYFIEKYWDKWSRYLGSHDMGIFHMVGQKIEPCYISNTFSSYIIQPNPVWVMPSLC